MEIRKISFSLYPFYLDVYKLWHFNHKRKKMRNVSVLQPTLTDLSNKNFKVAKNQIHAEKMFQNLSKSV